MADAAAKPIHPLGAVLVGGGSRRMGEDKALLRWRGATLVERAGRSLAAILPEVVIVGGVPEAYDFAGFPVRPDLRPGLGPLGGLDTALHHAAGRPVFLLACDLPRVSSDLVAHLVDRAGGGEERAAVWVPRAEGRRQPLCALYTAGCAGPLAEYLEAGGRRAVEFLDRLDATVVDLEPGHPLYRRGLLINVNRPTDLEALEADVPPDGAAR